MLDLGLSFLSSVARDPQALAIVDGEVRLGYAQWYRRISAPIAGLDAIGLRAGDHVVTALLAGEESFEGYWRPPEADARALRQGWYFTGDTGFMDSDGDIFVTGRVDDMIISGGESIAPVEIESCLSLHPAVSEVAVAGLADERLGKAVGAFIRHRAAVDTSDPPGSPAPRQQGMAA